MNAAPDRPLIVAPLYVPGDRPDRFQKAMHSLADAVIVDLEDAVAPERKAAARSAAAEFLAEVHDKPVWLRINHVDSPAGQEDLQRVGEMPGLSALRLPKVETVVQVVMATDALAGIPRVPVHLLVESALGVERAFELAAANSRVAGISLGEADLRSELGVDDAGLQWCRGRIVVAAVAAGLPPPLMSAHPEIPRSAASAEALERSCRLGRAMGFLGRTAIHPLQLPHIVRGFAPSDEEVTAAKRLIAAYEAARERQSGAVALPDGAFADIAMVRGARRILEMSAYIRTLLARL